MKKIRFFCGQKSIWEDALTGTKMINLIVIDEEAICENGLLLPGCGEVLRMLADEGILIAVNTHRSYFSVKKTFSSLIKSMVFICDDGAVMMKNGTLLYMGVINRRTLSQFKKTAESLSGTEMFLDLKDGNIKVAGENAAPLSSVTEEIAKITLYCENSGAALLDITPNLHVNRLRISYFDESVIEIVDAASSRHSSLAALMRRFGIASSETAAFLFNEASIPLISLAAVSMAPEDAPFELRDHIAHICKSVPAELLKILKHYVKQG